MGTTSIRFDGTNLGGYKNKSVMKSCSFEISREIRTSFLEIRCKIRGYWMTTDVKGRDFVILEGDKQANERKN